MQAFNSLPTDKRALVFYAESSADWPHLEPLLSRLLSDDPDLEINYLTSDSKDPVLEQARPLPDINYWKRTRTFNIGDGTIRTLMFRDLRCKVCVLTLPDLETYQLKRSQHPVHYIYVYHSLVSTHRVYQEKAFDAYDTILTVGPHHLAEIRKTEQAYRLKSKKILEHGYGRLDSLFEKQRQSRESYLPSTGASKRLVLAPSWGQCSFVEHSTGEALIEKLLSEHHRLSIRLHPMSVRHSPKLPERLEKRFADAAITKRLRVITDMSEQQSLAEADLMISDWSGASFDFAFAMERPVLFVDTPPKINNPAWEKIGIEPLEAAIRTEIGAVIRPGDWQALPEILTRLTANPAEIRTRIQEARNRWVYNLGKSSEMGAKAILEVLQ